MILNRAVVVGGVVLLGLVLFLVLRTRSRSTPTRDAVRGPTPDAGGADAELRGAADSGQVPGRSDPATERDVLAGLRTEDAEALRDAAAALRRLARTDPDVLALLLSRFLDPGLSSQLRCRLALVLGTLDAPEIDPLLIEALERFAEDADVVRHVLLALGGVRTPPDRDRVFGRGERPYGVPGSGGLGITVRRDLSGHDEARRAAIPLLRHPEASVRRAAAFALRASTAAVDVRNGYRASLRLERADEAASVMGEALAGWAASAPLSEERSDVLEELVRLSQDDELPALRLKLEKDLARAPLDGELVAVLLSAAERDRPFALRAFAFTVLAENARLYGGATRLAVGQRLVEALLDDPEAAVRDLAARLLGTLPWQEDRGAALVSAARDDPAWNVRYSAVGALSDHLEQAVARAVLEEAKDDPDSRVARIAREWAED